MSAVDSGNFGVAERLLALTETSPSHPHHIETLQNHKSNIQIPDELATSAIYHSSPILDLQSLSPDAEPKTTESITNTTPSSSTPSPTPTLQPPTTSTSPPAPIFKFNPEEECTICYTPLSTPCILHPCTHPFDLTCYLTWFDFHLTEIDSLFHCPPRSQILICPLCKQPITSLTELLPTSSISRNATYIVTKARSMRHARYSLKDNDPVDDRCLRRFQNVHLAYGWSLFFGEKEDFLLSGGWEIGVGELVRRDRLRGFEAMEGYEGVVKRAEDLGSVKEVRGYTDFLEELVVRNIARDRQLNVWGRFGEEEGECFEPDDVAAEFVKSEA